MSLWYFPTSLSYTGSYAYASSPFSSSSAVYQCYYYFVSSFHRPRAIVVPSPTSPGFQSIQSLATKARATAAVSPSTTVQSSTTAATAAWSTTAEPARATTADASRRSSAGVQACAVHHYDPLCATLVTITITITTTVTNHTIYFLLEKKIIFAEFYFILLTIRSIRTSATCTCIVMARDLFSAFYIDLFLPSLFKLSFLYSGTTSLTLELSLDLSFCIKACTPSFMPHVGGRRHL